MSHIPIILYAVAILWAVIQAIVHFRVIGDKKMTKEYKYLWTVARGIAFIASAAVLWCRHPDDFWQLSTSCVGAFFVFAATFPFILNILMGWHPFYLGNTSETDILTISKLTGTDPNKVRHSHQHEYRNNEWYKSLVHTAGAITAFAYALCSATLYLIAVSQ